MKKKIRISGILVLMLILLFIFIPNKRIAGYSYLPFMNERIEIIPPPHSEPKLERIIIEDKEEINLFIDLIKESKLDPMGEGLSRFTTYRNNNGRLFYGIGVYSEFPERNIGWEFWIDENGQGYLFPTLSSYEGEYVASLELIEWMDKIVEEHWSDMELQ